ncbi:MAG: heavy metal-binding domain-containing protein [Uliginosibacterium sp.]|nr:heavy metal-binding domain-containing protein [Uliginosibacterium sp.]
MEFLIKLGVFLVLVAVGYWRGRRNERAHLKSLDAEEDALTDILIFATRYPPASAEVLDPVLVSGSAVIGSDYFRLFVAGLRKIVGGNYRAYEQLMERGRRQALVRLKQAAKAKGAKMVFNVRITTSRISNSRGGEATQVEVLAYGTAFVRARGRSPRAGWATWRAWVSRWKTKSRRFINASSRSTGCWLAWRWART